MSAGKMHVDEIDTNVSLVARLLTTQFPQWADLPLDPVPSAGTDNALYRLGDDMLVRLPRMHWAIEQLDKEHRWLPRLAPFLPLAIPGLVATFLFVLVFTWNEYLLALFLSSANSQTLPLVIAAQNATRGPQWWNMSVLILIMIVPVIVIAIILERYITRGLLIGAVKG